MTEAGCEAWYPSDTLAVMGLAEILGHLPRLLRCAASWSTRFTEAAPDAYIGIDSRSSTCACRLRCARAASRRCST